MFSFINRTLLDIPLTWDRTRFKSTRSQYRQARKLIETSINVQFERQLKTIHSKNVDLERNIIETNEHLSKHETKVNMFDNLTEIASESLTVHLDKRMKNIRTTIEQHFNGIQALLQEEKQYWKNIHSAMDQNLITVNDIHRCVQNTSPLPNDETDLSPSSDKNLIVTKTERVSVVLPSINKKYVIKLEETTNRLSSIYSQPNLPAQLYFSPTILQDEESENIPNILSPLEMKPRVMIHRVSQSFLLDYLKTNENNQQNSFALPEPILKPISRKRKQSVSEEIDNTSKTIALRKRKSVSFAEIDEKKPRKRRNKKSNKKQISIRDSAMDRLNNLTLSTMHTKNDNNDPIGSKSHFRLRKKRSNKS